MANKSIQSRPAPSVAPKATGRMIGAICPCCGRVIPENRAIKAGRLTVDRVPYFESIDWVKDKPFGVSYSCAGKGSLRDRHHINPEDAPELFEAVKARLLAALEEWMAKNWITQEEIGSLSILTPSPSKG